jgi:hypothetical protein
VDESRNQFRDLPSPLSDAGDSDWEDVESLDDQKPAATLRRDSSSASSTHPASSTGPSPSVDPDTPADHSDSSCLSSSEEEEEIPTMYADLAPFIKKIRFKQDTKQNFWWAIYDNLTV